MAFDPENADTEVLRTVALLLRILGITATILTGDTAEEKIGEAITQLEKIDSIKKTAGSIQKNAVRTENECTSIATGIRRLLDEALVALAGTRPLPTSWLPRSPTLPERPRARPHEGTGPRNRTWCRRLSARRPARSRAARGRHRSAAGGRSCGTGRRAARATARSNRGGDPARRAP